MVNDNSGVSQTMAKALEAMTLATITATKQAAHENECARRYADSQRAYDDLRETVMASTQGVRDALTQSVVQFQSSVSALSENTNRKINGVYVILLSCSGATLLAFLGATLAYVFHH